MSHTDRKGLKIGARDPRRRRREYTKCRKHAECRARSNSIWRKR